jgi:hypothetical protein
MKKQQPESENLASKQLLDAYRMAGEGFLAYRLIPLFAEIKTEEDRILHNAVLKEVLLMIEPDTLGFYLAVSKLVLRIKGKGNLLKEIAKQVFNTGYRKG